MLYPYSFLNPLELLKRTCLLLFLWGVFALEFFRVRGLGAPTLQSGE